MTIARGVRSEFGARVRIRVAGEQELSERFAANLSAGGMFIRDDRPPAVGTSILIEFVLPDGSALSRIEARVMRSKPADTPGEATAGMGVEFVNLDEWAKKLANYRAPKPTELPRPPVIENLSAAAGKDVVGIDLGTTNSCIALVDNGQPRVLATMAGFETVPSVVFVGKPSDKKKVLTGHKAVERMILEPQRAIYGSKRFIGRPFKSREVSTFGHFFHYALAEGARGFTAVKIDDQVYPLEWVSGCILAHLKHIAQTTLGRPLERAIITVPAYFGESQREAVREAGKLAGFTVERVLSEPTAAAVAFGFGRGLQKTVLVYDLGGGTFDASVVRIDGDEMRVLSTDGDAFLGGSDFDDRITELLLANIERTHGINLRNEPVTVQRVRFAAEMAKKQLSQAKLARIDVPYLAQTPAGAINLNTTLELELFENLTEDLVQRTLGIVENVLRMAGLKSAEIDEIVLVGGQSRSPFVAARLQERFGKKPSRGVHPDHAVALGAAIVAAAAYAPTTTPSPVQLSLTDVLPADIALLGGDGTLQPILKRGTALPAQAAVEVSTASGNKEYIAMLYRGQSANPADCELLGQVKLPSSFALALSKTKATLSLLVSADGLLSASLKHPLTDEVHTVSITLDSRPEAELMEVNEADMLL